MTDYQRIEKAILYLDSKHKEQPSLKALAKIVGLSEFHFHRMFTRWAGITPKEFLKFVTARTAKSLLIQSRDILTSSLESGLSGPSRLHDLMIRVDGVTPGEFKNKGRGLEIRYGIHQSQFGPFLIAITERGICALSFLDKNKLKAVKDLAQTWQNAKIIRDQKETKKIAKSVFNPAGARKISVLLKGTSFQLKVWEAVLRIPEGHVATYGEIAKFIGQPKASRAVGTAIGDNALALLIPCHRVIRQTGHFGDYRWGIPRKKAILLWETSGQK